MIQKINKSNIIKIFIIMLMIITLTLLNNNQEHDSVLTSSQETSNKKIGWGLKRNDNHEQPDVGKENKKVLESNNKLEN